MGESYPRQCWTPDGKHFVEDTTKGPLPIPGPITVSGEITCLPKKGSGAQTMECAIGLKALDGRHYGLKNLFQHDPRYKFSVGGLRVEVSGTFSSEEMKGPDGNKYDVVGIIDITSIKETTDGSDQSGTGTIQPGIKDVMARHEFSLMNTPGVVGIGIGECDKMSCIRVYLEKETLESKSIPKQLEGFKVDVVITGPVKAL